MFCAAQGRPVTVGPAPGNAQETPMRLYELITFTLRVRTPAAALARLESTLAEALPGCTLVGCWASEIGPLNQIAVLRGFTDETTRQTERERYLPATFSPLQ